MVALASVVVMLLWNWLMPALFGLPEISYLQSLGLLVLSKLLLGGFGKGHRSSHGRHWKWRFNEKWDEMSDEEKEEFRQKLTPKP